MKTDKEIGTAPIGGLRTRREFNEAIARARHEDLHIRWQEFMQNYLESATDAGQGGQPVERLEMSFLME